MAKAIDSSSNSSSAQISVNVNNVVADTTAPSVAITSPANGDIINPRTSITIQASASDNVGMIKVEFYINGSLICTDTTASYACGYNLPGAKGASYQIEARAYDSAGNIGSHQIQILSSGQLLVEAKAASDLC